MVNNKYWARLKKANSSNFINRGGSYNNDGSDNPVSYRNNNNASNANDNIGFRSRL